MLWNVLSGGKTVLIENQCPRYMTSTNNLREEKPTTHPVLQTEHGHLNANALAIPLHQSALYLRPVGLTYFEDGLIYKMVLLQNVICGAPGWLSWKRMWLLILGLMFEPHIGCRDYLNKYIFKKCHLHGEGLSSGYKMSEIPGKNLGSSEGVQRLFIKNGL